MMKIRAILAVLCGLSFLLLTGCASIVSGVHQTISVNTPSHKDATCTLTNNKGKWYINKTPGSVTVQQSYQDMSIQCEKNGNPIGDTKLVSKVKPIYFGNIIFGGVIGLFIDAANGAAYAYPNNVDVTTTTPAKK